MAIPKALRVATRVLAGLVVVLSVLAAFVWFVLDTEPGARLVLGDLDRLGLDVSVAEVEGTLRGPLELHGVSFEMGAASGEIRRLDLEWQLRDLLRRNVHVERLRIEGARVSVEDVAGVSQSPARTPTPAHDISLPVDIVVERARVEDLNLDLPGGVAIRDAAIQARGTDVILGTEISGKLTAPQTGPVTFRIEARATRRGLRLRHGRIDLLGGTVTADGWLGWAPEVAWRLSLEADTLEPSRILPDPAEWPGRLTLRGGSAGRLAATGPAGRLRIDTLHGTLRRRPLAGRLALELEPDGLRVPSLTFDWGDATMRGSGGLNRELDFEFQARVPDVGLALPNASGSLQLQGRVAGTRTSPAVDAEFAVGGFAWREQRVGAASGELNIDSGDTLAANVDVQATALMLAGQQLDSLTVAGRGSRPNHRVTATAVRDSARLRVTAAGAWTEGTWQGAVRGLQLESPRVGDWSLADSAVAVTASPAVVSLAEDLCINAENSGICVAGAWRRSAAWEASATIEAIPLALANPALPTTWSLAGDLSGSIQVARRTSGDYAIIVDLEPSRGTVTYPVMARRRELDYRDARVRLQASEDGAQAAASLTVLEHAGQPIGRLEASLTLPDYGGTLPPRRDQPLDGRVLLELEQLGPVAAMVRNVEELSGGVALEVRARGTVARPVLLGEARWRNGEAYIPAFGLQLRDIELTATGEEGGQIVLDGRASSGDGEMRVTGDSPLKPTRERPTRISLEGERFLTMNTGRARVAASPKLEVEFDGQRVSVDGEVHIPEARIQLREISEAAIPVSDDVVFVDSIRTTAEERAVAATVRLTLGDSVSISGFGFRADLQGSLRVVEQPSNPTRATGTLRIVEGRYKAYGQELTIERGRLTFAGGPIDNPGLDIRATRVTSDSVLVGLLLSGTLRTPMVTLFSEPSMPQSEVLARLATGRGLGDVGNGDGDPLATAQKKLGLKGANLLVKKIAAELDLDEARVQTEGSLQEASLVTGKYLSPRIYVAYGASLFDPLKSLQVRYLLTSSWTLMAETGDATSAEILYEIELGE